ncbi:MAG: hypothetical protein IKH04_07195 [Kiritimatiellae bacterium]|nr:hypothetical protein [Kiritimatiellia bacterium]
MTRLALLASICVPLCAHCVENPAAEGARERAQLDPVAYIETHLAAGERAVVVPKGDYRLALPEGRTAYFRLIGLADVTIDFSDSRPAPSRRTCESDIGMDNERSRPRRSALTMRL